MTIRVLGAVTVLHEGEFKHVAPAGRNVLAILVAAGRDGLSDDQLADEIWGDDLTPSWSNNLRRAVSRMRRSLPVDAIQTGGRHYALRLPNDEIDAWQLLDHTSIDLTEIADERLHSLLADTPYPDPSGSRLVAAGIEQVEAARIELIDRLRSGAPDRVTPTLLTGLAQAARSSWNDELIRVTVQLHELHGSAATAERLADESTERFERELGVSPAIVAPPGETPDDDDALQISASPARWLGPGRDATGVAEIQRTALGESVTHQLGAGPVVITGESGSGKSLLARNLARDRHASGNHVVWVVAQRDATSAYGPVLAVLPQMAATFEINAGETDHAFAETQRVTGFARQLHAVCPDRPITVVVDDAQWLDSRSAQLVDFLTKSNDDRLELVVVGRADDDPARWRTMTDALVRAGAATITLGPFDHDELADLVGRMRPSTTSRQRSEFAQHLIELRADLPIVAVEVIANANTDPLVPGGDRNSQLSIDSVWSEAVSEPTRRIAAAAALLGVTWRFSDVLELTGSDANSLADGTDELLDANLLLAEARPDCFSFRHALIREDFTAQLGQRERRDLHQKAASFAERDGRVHARARHLLAAMPMIEPATAADALIASARAHLDNEAWLEAATDFAAADRLGPERLGARALGYYACAIERSGADPQTVRRRGIALARETNDPAAMVEVILDGTDSGELLEANATRLELLDEVAGYEVAATDRRRLDVARCRELGLAGRHDEARALHATMADESSDTADDRAAVWLALWTSLLGTPVSSWPPGPPDADAVEDPVNRARIRAIACERALVIGDHDSFDREVDLLAQEPASQQHPKRRWAVHLLLALRAHCQGAFVEAASIADAGLAVGVQHGLAGAFPARSAQVFADHWIRGCHADLVPLLDAAAPDLRDSLIATAARGVALLELDDRHDEGRAVINDVVTHLDATTQAVHSSIAVLFAGVADHLTSYQRQRLTEILESHAGAAVVLGAGIAHLGPATRALAQLASDTGDADSLLRTSVEEADSWGLPVWSVRCRLDLFMTTSDNEALEQARSLATHTELASLLP